jgi:hypothetical protein
MNPRFPFTPLFRFLNIFAANHRLLMRRERVRAQEVFPNEKNHPFSTRGGVRGGNFIACCHTLQLLFQQYGPDRRWGPTGAALAGLLSESLCPSIGAH